MAEPRLAPVRVHLTGRVSVGRGGRLVDEPRFPGAQGRLVFAMLVGGRRRAVSREELALELWGDQPPRAWDTALRALVSKLRAILAEVVPVRDPIARTGGAYRLDLPADAWVDLEAAGLGIHRAEDALRRGRVAEAVAWALGPRSIAGRPFLVGSEGPWATRRSPGSRRATAAPSGSSGR